MTLLAAVLLALMVPAAARANDRALRATSVPAAACVEVRRSLAPVDEPWSDGRLAVRAQAGPEVRFVTARCPLPVASVADQQGAGASDLTAIRVHYLDSDGRGGDAQIAVDLYQVSIRNGDVAAEQVCGWYSDQDGTGSTAATRSVKACPLHLTPGTFYYFEVSLIVAAVAGDARAEFVGIDFP